MKLQKIILLLGLTLGLTTFSWAQRPGDNPGDLPDNVDTSDCTSKPPAKNFDIKLKWKSKDMRPQNSVHGCSTPLVADMDGDGYPEVIGVWCPPGLTDGYNVPGGYITNDLLVLDGRTGDLKYKIKTKNFQTMGQTIAIGDVDGDGKSEVFIESISRNLGGGRYNDRYVYCYDGSKANNSADDYKWKSQSQLDYMFSPLLADINNDGIPELVFGGTIFNSITGAVLVKGTMATTGMGYGDPHCVHGTWNTSKTGSLGEGYCLCAVADIDGDNQLEVCAGNTVYKVNITNPTGLSGNSFTTLRQCTATLPYNDMYDGQTFVLDFDNDGDMDVCVIGNRKDAFGSGIFSGGQNHIGLYVWEGQSTDLIGYCAINPKTFSLSIPFAADIDGDGFPEVIANGWILGYHWLKNENYMDMMHVWRYKKGYTSSGELQAKNIQEVFTRERTREYSESAGFTVFDFNQDGKSEIVYRGRNNLYILDGTTLSKLCTPQECLSGTLAEYPIVADVDCDGHADIIVTDQYDISVAPGSMKVYESKTPSAWGPARKVWNQWPYNVVNVNEDMTIPKYQFDITHVFGNGEKPFNAFLKQQTKLNKDGEMFATAANAYIDTTETKLTQHCDSITIDITFGNSGTEALYKPYGLIIYKDEYKGVIVYQRTFTDEDLEIKTDRSLHLKYTEADLQQFMPLDKIVITINDIGTGIAEEGGQQMECDTSNNRFEIEFPGFVSTEYGDTVVHMCVGDMYAIGNSIYTEAGTYVDTLVNRMGCDSIVTSYVYTHSLSVDLGPDQSFCSKEYNPVTLDAGVVGTDSTVVSSGYEWSNGTSDRTLTVFETGDYGVTIFEEYPGGHRCTATDTVNITIITNPELYITKDAEDFCAAGHVTLTANSTVPDADFQWNTGETSQSITVSTHGTYTVIADNQGCTGTANITIPICPCEVWVPNAFTPNKDDVNDVFLPQVSNNLASYELMIFDRWGKMIFRTEDVNEAWDGTVKGTRLPSDVFTYVIYYTCMSAPDHKERKVGSVTIVR
ncbi:MAG: gliding motility-associated C-terminal domain-containing protein [Bacteroidales bacterium]|nr:gliding motility-associated C-terminal domain-containing protein [Bacteroidales bacterium]